jgi:hypothetical protein
MDMGRWKIGFLLSFIITASLCLLQSCSNDGDMSRSQSGYDYNKTVRDVSTGGKGPVLDRLAMLSYAADSVTLKRPVCVKQGTAPAFVNAYIGVNGVMAPDDEVLKTFAPSKAVSGQCFDGEPVKEYKEGPVDVSQGDYCFKGLRADESYRIIVVAGNDKGYSIRYINPVRPDAAEADPSVYPSMDDKEIGHMKYFFRVAEGDLDDFSLIKTNDLFGIPGTGQLQYAFTAYRYSIAFMTYFLAVEQFHKLSACPEIIRPRMDRMIQKMLNKKVWQYWSYDSLGLPPIEPNFWFNYTSQPDPIKDKNIMYSGHLAHMMALYEKLYRDYKWSNKNSMVLPWTKKTSFVYDGPSLMKRIYDQFIEARDHCIECEPNLCFPECNQHPVLALKLYDDLHGTKFYPESQSLLMDWFLKYDIITAAEHSTAGVFLVKQRLVIGQQRLDFGNPISAITVPLSEMGLASIYAAVADGWTGSFMHAWQPEYIEGHYPYQKRDRIREIDENTARVKYDGITDQLSTPFFAMLAAEMGDHGLRDRLLNWMDNNFTPVWEEDGSYRYLVGSDIVVNPVGYTPWANVMTAILAANARAYSKNCLQDMHNKAFDGADPYCPLVVDMDYPDVRVRRAIFDRKRELVIVTLEPANAEKKSTLFKIIQLDPARTWCLKMDGKELGRYANVTSVVVDVPISGRHDITLSAE